MSILAGKKTKAWLAVLVVLTIGLAIGLVFGSTIQDADAAKRKPELKTLSAVVAADGTLVRGKGATTASNMGSSTYWVFFNRDVSQCAYTATTSDGYAGNISVDETLPASSGYVVVSTYNVTSHQDLAFHLIVVC